MNKEKKKILVMFGGPSPEHEVSRKSASSVVKNIDRDLYDIDIIGITKEGRWYLTNAGPHEIADGSWAEKQDNVPAVISPDRTVHGYVTGEAGAPDGKKVRVDCVFPVFHGECGEDGTIQGLLQLANIPFIGCDMTSSACSMDKAVTKMIADSTGIRQAKYFKTTRFEIAKHPEEVVQEIEENFNVEYPLFVKPASAGSSLGITMAKNRDDLLKGLKIAVTYDHKVLVEQAINGREFGVSVLGNEEILVSPVGEVVFDNEFCEYDVKYTKSLQRIDVETDLSKEKLEEMQNASANIFRTLGCRGMARVDFFYEDETGEVIFNELNTIPGFTDISMYPKMWQAVGISYGELLTKLIKLALEQK